MPREFSTEARVSSFELPALTKQQIKEQIEEQQCDAREVIIRAVQLLHRLRQMEHMRGLILDLDLPLEEVVYRAVLELWQREIGEPERDVLAELDELKQRFDTLTAEFERRGE